MIVLKPDSGSLVPGYRADNGYTMRREPDSLVLRGKSCWVLRDKDGVVLGRDPYRNDLAERNGCVIKYADE